MFSAITILQSLVMLLTNNRRVMRSCHIFLGAEVYAPNFPIVNFITFMKKKQVFCKNSM